MLKNSQMSRRHKIVEGILCMILMVMVSLAIIQIVVPNNWISVTNYCGLVFNDWNSTRWYSGAYSDEEVREINECFRRLNGSYWMVLWRDTLQMQTVQTQP